MSLLFSDPSLLVVIMDITPSEWEDRDKIRQVQDHYRQKQKKDSIGPATFHEYLSTVTGFTSSFSLLNRNNALIIIGVAGNEVSVLYPRKGSDGGMDSMVHDPAEHIGCKIDLAQLNKHIQSGTTDLINKNAEQLASRVKIAINNHKNATSAEVNGQASSTSVSSAAMKISQIQKGAAIASAFSMALCIINRFMVASHGGTSASANALRGTSGSNFTEDDKSSGIVTSLFSSSSSSTNNNNTKGGSSSSSGEVTANSAKNEKRAQENEDLLNAGKANARGMLSPRILILQVTPDRTKDYNSFMNCSFACMKRGIPVDGCFLKRPVQKKKSRSSQNDDGNNNNNNQQQQQQQQHASSQTSSTFLEQTCDLTNGVYVNPSEPTQPNGGLMGIFTTTFLCPNKIRPGIVLPMSKKVDFRSRCFQTGKLVDVAYVCNLCLSIFKQKPMKECPTCGATIYDDTKDNGSSDNSHS